jgi:hypothetical protein
MFNSVSRVLTIKLHMRTATVYTLAGAALTNPVDVLRNEMFKTDLSIRNTLKKLIEVQACITYALMRPLADSRLYHRVS